MKKILTFFAVLAATLIMLLAVGLTNSHRVNDARTFAILVIFAVVLAVGYALSRLGARKNAA